MPDDEQAKAAATGMPAADTVLLGRRTYEATKLVFSRTLKEVTWNNARLVRELHADEIAAMKQRPGKNIMIASAADQSCRS